MDGYSDLDVRTEGDVFHVAFDRPERLNAVGRRTHAELTRVFREPAARDARVVVLTGTGDAFSAGGDLAFLEDCLDDPAAFRSVVREGEEIVRSLLALETPVVARVNGDATGFGATLALLSDVAVVAEDARIGDPHVRAGLVAGDGGALVWPLLCGMARAKEFLLTGDLVDAREAVEMGLVARAVPPEELDAEVDDVVETLATGPQTAIRYTKRSLNAWLEFGADLVLRESLALEAVSQRDPDHREAVAAFREGRRPRFPSAREVEEDGEAAESGSTEDGEAAESGSTEDGEAAESGSTEDDGAEDGEAEGDGD